MDTNVDSHNDLTRYAAAKEKDIDHIRAKLKRNQDKNDAKLKSSFPPKRQLRKEGSLTAERGQQAHRDIAREVVDMCQVIWDHALMTDNWDQEDNIACILFQNLFSIYSKISGNVVGLLQRARKYGVVHFEGETLFQGRNNMTPIFVLRDMKGVKEVFQRSSDAGQFDWGVIGSS